MNYIDISGHLAVVVGDDLEKSNLIATLLIFGELDKVLGVVFVGKSIVKKRGDEVLLFFGRDFRRNEESRVEADIVRVSRSINLLSFSLALGLGGELGVLLHKFRHHLFGSEMGIGIFGVLHIVCVLFSSHLEQMAYIVLQKIYFNFF